MGEKNTKTKSPAKSRDNPVKLLFTFTCFFFMSFSLPKYKEMSVNWLSVNCVLVSVDCC